MGNDSGMQGHGQADESQRWVQAPGDSVPDTGGSGGGPLQTEKLSEQVYRLLRARIVNGHLEPGARLSMEALLGELGISKTPLREALTHLERDRLVVTRPRSGTYVATPTLRDINDVCELRRGIEWQALHRAADALPPALLADLVAEVDAAEQAARAGDYAPFFASDTRLHRTLLTHADNPRLLEVWEAISGYVHWLRVLGATGPHRVLGSSARHRELLAALQRGARDEALATLALHIDEVRRWMIEDALSGGVPGVPLDMVSP